MKKFSSKMNIKEHFTDPLKEDLKGLIQDTLEKRKIPRNRDKKTGRKYSSIYQLHGERI